MQDRLRQIVIHVLGCIGFLALPIIFSPGPKNPLDIFHNSNEAREFTGYLLILGFFYLNFLVLTPKYYFTKRYLLFGLLVLGYFSLVVMLPNLIIPEQPRMPREGHGPPKSTSLNILMHVSHNFFLFFMVFFFSLMLRISNQWKQARQEKIDAELSYLKAQINPHFLFNTLNSIYSLAIEKSDYTPTAIVKLSGMMRYVLNETKNDWVPLKKELEYINDYIELQKLRLGDTIQLDYQISGEMVDKKIAPLILIPFIENAFKHGVNPDQESSIQIRIEISDINLTLAVTNKKVSQSGKIEKSGLGIENTKHRLDMLYPSEYDLSINNGSRTFSVILKLLLK